ncbi:hypothetical protein DRQ32_05780 [bacterium]|nr:MAG: hypothetical protein DRQ32_05780 [bacterium]
MRTITLIALVFLAAPFVRVAVQGSELRGAHWPNGNPRSKMEAHRNLQGEMVRHGRIQLFYEDGSLWSNGHFDNDLEQGRWQWYTQDGILKSVCDYESGVGQYRDLTPAGRIVREGTMEGDTRQGPWREYWPSGRLKLEGRYVDDIQHGRWTAWSDEAPARQASALYEHGTIVEPD